MAQPTSVGTQRLSAATNIQQSCYCLYRWLTRFGTTHEGFGLCKCYLSCHRIEKGVAEDMGSVNHTTMNGVQNVAAERPVLLVAICRRHHWHESPEKERSSVAAWRKTRSA